MASVFVSYSRRSGDVVKTLVSDFDALGHTVWFDQDLSGGHAWWSQIIGRVRECDVFVFILDPDSLDSTACQREYGYAADLGKRILPVLVSGAVSTNLLPPALSQIQFVDYRAQDRDAVLRLAKALAALPPPTPLPNPLPPAPGAPTSYLGNLTSQVETTSTLSYEQQSALLVDLRRHLRDPGTADDARTLLERLRKRRDLFATIAEEMSELIVIPTREPARAPDPRPIYHVTNTVVATVAAADVEPRRPDTVPTPVTGPLTPSRRERRKCAVVGMIVGTTVGAGAMTTVSNFEPVLLGFGFVTGVGGAIAGAITGARLRLILVALLAALIGWSVVSGQTSRDAFATGAVFGAPIGVVLGAILGSLLRKRIRWLDSHP